MPTEINGYSPSQETPLSSLVINEVDSTETFEKMKEKGLLQDNQLYLVTDEQPSAGIDEVPTAGSKNLVYSGGVYDALKQVGSADSVTEQNKGLKQKFWRGTKAEFEAVEMKSDDTMYIIVDDNGTIVEPGGMQPSVYDPQGRATDIFAYVDNTQNTNIEAHNNIRERIDAITVPTKVSELENDSGYLTSYTETDPTVPSWAKAETKPIYTADEVGARPDTWMPTAAQVGAATEEYVNQAIQTAIGDALGGSY